MTGKVPDCLPPKDDLMPRNYAANDQLVDDLTVRIERETQMTYSEILGCLAFVQMRFQDRWREAIQDD